MNKLTCIVVDDESIARKALEDYISKIDDLAFVSSFKNGMEAKKWLSTNEVDLLFLDINMPILNGLELLRLLKNSPPVIFTTAYSQHALESFEFNVVDYLLKPISFERFLQAVNKARKFSEQELKKKEQVLVLKEGGSVVKIELKDIFYIEAMQNYIQIHTKVRKFMILMTLKEISSQLNEVDFIQTHRSFIVQLDKVDMVNKDTIIMGDFHVPLSKRNKSYFLEKFRTY